MRLALLAVAVLPAVVSACVHSAPVASAPLGAPAIPRWLVAGHVLTCLLGRDDSLRCWGQLALETSLKNPPANWVEPRALDGFARVRSFDVGAFGPCALLASGRLVCRNESPTMPAGAASVAVGDGHACALMSSGRVLCWGSCGQGECGAPPVEKLQSPRPVEGLSGVVSLSLGLSHSCALLDDGTVKCWGNNEAGQLGDGTTRSRPQPGPVRGLTGVTRITAKKLHACALRRDGAVHCWGLGDDGQLGLALPVDGKALSPVAVPGLSEVEDAAAGGAHTCALRKGRVYCWGGNQRGQLGRGTLQREPRPAPEQLQPREVPGLDGVVAIAAGGGHQCAAKADGSVWCWGNNFFGQAGRVAGKDVPSPQFVTTR